MALLTCDDALFHGPGWTPRPQFEADVSRFSTHGQWPGRVAEVGDRHPELPVVRLRDHTEVARWLAGPLAAVVAGHRQ